MNGNSSLARGLAVLVAAAVLAVWIPAPAAPVRAATDGAVTIHVWTCPPNVTDTTGDPAVYAGACTTPASSITFALTFPKDDVPLTRKTDYPTPGSGEVRWNAPFPDVVTIKLDNPPPGTTSVVFCDQGQGLQPAPLADGATLKENFSVPAGGLDCQWYFVPAPEPTATPVPPTSTPTPTVQPTATVAPTSTPTPTQTPTQVPTNPPDIAATTEPSPAETPIEEPSDAPTPKFIKKPIRIAALPVLNGANFAYAYAINDDRIIVGASGLADADGKHEWQSAVRWVGDGQSVEELPAPPRGIFNEARDINKSGQIVGYAVTAEGHPMAVLWDQDEPTLLGFLGSGTESQAYAINDRGQIVGVSTTAPGQSLNGEGSRAFLWDPDEGMIDLGTLNGAPKSIALDISGDGLIVGQSGGHAVAWGPDRAILDFGIAGYAATVSASGWVAGAFAAGDAYSHAYLMAPAATTDEMIDLKNIRKAYARIYSMNNGNVVVGQSCDQPCPNGRARAVLWQNGKVYDLQKLLDDGVSGMWDLRGAYGLNKRGDIVGYGDYQEDANDPESVRTVGFIMFAGARNSVVPGMANPTPTPKPTVTEPPREIKVGDDYFLKDRIVPVRKSDLVEATSYESFVVYARTAEGPFAALYIPVSKHAADGMVRYLPEHVDTGGNITCPAEQPSATLQSSYQVDKYLYVYAGTEPDIGGSLLSPISSNSGSAYYETGSPAPIKEFYIKVNDQFERWIRIDDTIVGLVDQLAPGFSFAGQSLSFRETLTETASLRLERVGCAGPFKVQAEFGQGSRAAKLYIVVGDKTLVFNATAPGSTDADSATSRAPIDAAAAASLPGSALVAQTAAGPAPSAAGGRPGRPSGSAVRGKVVPEPVPRRVRSRAARPRCRCLRLPTSSAGEHRESGARHRTRQRSVGSAGRQSPISGQREGVGP